MPRGVYPGNKGKKLSEETRKKMSKSRMGHFVSLETRKKMIGNTNGFKKGQKSKKPTLGKHWKLSEETKKNMSGQNSHSWKDGRCQNKEYISWLKNKRNRMPKIGGHTWEEWETLKAQYNWTCPCCHKSESESEIKLTQDHIIPLSKGGSDNIENIQPLCRGCNFKKHTKIIKY